GFLQAQAGQGTDNLDNGDLVGAGGLQHDVELGLFLLGGSSAGSGSSNSGGSGGNAELILEGVNQLSQLQHSQGLDFFNHSSDLFGCHCKLPPIIVIIVSVKLGLGGLFGGGSATLGLADLVEHDGQAGDGSQESTQNLGNQGVLAGQFAEGL